MLGDGSSDSAIAFSFADFISERRQYRSHVNTADSQDISYMEELSFGTPPDVLQVTITPVHLQYQVIRLTFSKLGVFNQPRYPSICRSYTVILPKKSELSSNTSLICSLLRASSGNSNDCFRLTSSG